jgi:hypothetical protein
MRFLDCFASLAMTTLVGYDFDRSVLRRGEWIRIMQHDASIAADGIVAADTDILTFDVSDSALEKAAAAIPGGAGGAMSFPNAPTVSILVICCSFND